MENLLTNIENDIDWRKSQMGIIKLLPMKTGLTNKEADFLMKISIPTMYSLWEGFLKNTYEFIHKYIHRNIKLDPEFFKNDLHIYAYILNKSCNLERKRDNVNDIVGHVEKIFEIIDEPYIKSSLKYEGSTFNYTNTNKMLSIFSISPIDQRYEDELNEFLDLRNKIVHRDGVRFIEVGSEKIHEFSIMIINLMYDIFLNIENRFNEY